MDHEGIGSGEVTSGTKENGEEDVGNKSIASMDKSTSKKSHEGEMLGGIGTNTENGLGGEVEENGY